MPHESYNAGNDGISAVKILIAAAGSEKQAGSDQDEANHEPQSEQLDEESLRAAREVYAILERFPVDERVAFALRYINGLDLTAVASACGVSLATIKRRLQRAEGRFFKVASGVPALADWMKGVER